MVFFYKTTVCTQWPQAGRLKIVSKDFVSPNMVSPKLVSRFDVSQIRDTRNSDTYDLDGFMLRTEENIGLKSRTNAFPVAFFNRRSTPSCVFPVTNARH